MRPLVPASVDLRDFPFMPVDVARVLTSETWILGTGDERAAAVTLWLSSWHQVPAGSLPKDDRMLAHLSQSRNWARVRGHALRGWVECDDGRLYHPVVCEKVLEAWLEKLAQRQSSGAGNASRWGYDFDPAPVEADMECARELLRALNPKSRALTKKRTAARKPSEGGGRHKSGGDADGNPNGTPDGNPKRTPVEIARDRDRDRDSKSKSKSKSSPPARTSSAPTTAPEPTAAARACLLMRQAGCIGTNPSHVDLLAGLAEGVTPEVYRDTTAEAIALGKANPFTWAITTARARHAEGARPVNANGSEPHAQRSSNRRLSAVERVEANIRRARRERGEAFADDAGGDVIDGTAVRVED